MSRLYCLQTLDQQTTVVLAAQHLKGAISNAEVCLDWDFSKENIIARWRPGHSLTWINYVLERQDPELMGIAPENVVKVPSAPHWERSGHSRYNTPSSLYCGDLTVRGETFKLIFRSPLDFHVMMYNLLQHTERKKEKVPANSWRNAYTRTYREVFYTTPDRPMKWSATFYNKPERWDRRTAGWL